MWTSSVWVKVPSNIRVPLRRLGSYRDWLPRPGRTQSCTRSSALGSDSGCATNWCFHPTSAWFPSLQNEGGNNRNYYKRSPWLHTCRGDVGEEPRNRPSTSAILSVTSQLCGEDPRKTLPWSLFLAFLWGAVRSLDTPWELDMCFPPPLLRAVILTFFYYDP